MPRLWLGFDRAVPTVGRSLEISFAEFTTTFGDRRVRFLYRDRAISNEDGVGNGSQHVVLEVAGDELKPPLFVSAGFYLVEGLSPDSASVALRKRGHHG